MGTELSRRGIDTALPLWSAHALTTSPEVVTRIHGEHLAAGAEVLTSNTFRTHRRSLQKAGRGDSAAELTELAVRLAREVADSGPGSSPPDDAGAGPRYDADARPRYVAGSVAPLEDCYSPALTPPQLDLQREHEEMAANLARAGVDLVLVETMPTIREAVAATIAASATGLPVLVGFTCGRDGRLVSGESMTDAVRCLEPAGADGLLVNCTPAEAIHVALGELSASASVPVGAYGNVGHAENEQGWSNTDVLDPAEYLGYARRWLNLGAQIVGCCCGTTVAHVAALREMLDETEPSAPVTRGD